MSNELFDVKFHFPYASISIEKVDDADVGRYSTRIHAGRSFTARRGNTEFTINPAMLTYMEVTPHRPF